jgi:zinc and cadmium transporter
MSVIRILWRNDIDLTFKDSFLRIIAIFQYNAIKRLLFSMNSPLVYALFSTVLVSIISLVGIFTLSLNKKFLMKSLFILISLSAGALLGDVFFHLLPELTEDSAGFTTEHGAYVLLGILLFFVLEKFIIWHHCHGVETPEDHELGDHAHSQSLGAMNLVGDGLHNLIDGMIIGASYLISPAVGVATTVAVILHEIPQEIGDFGVLIHSGFTVKRALLFNLLFSFFAIIGAVLSYYIGADNEFYLKAIIPIVAGGFLYIAGSDLIPELMKESSLRNSFIQLLVLILGISLMYALVLLEPVLM